jgi:hypothetical protein
LFDFLLSTKSLFVLGMEIRNRNNYLLAHLLEASLIHHL